MSANRGYGSLCVAVSQAPHVARISDIAVLLAEAGAHQRHVLDAAVRPGVGVAVLLDDEVLRAEAATVDVQAPPQLEPCADLTDGGVEHLVLVEPAEPRREGAADCVASVPLAEAAGEERAERDVGLERQGEPVEVARREPFDEQACGGELRCGRGSGCASCHRCTTAAAVLTSGSYPIFRSGRRDADRQPASASTRPVRIANSAAAVRVVTPIFV